MEALSISETNSREILKLPHYRGLRLTKDELKNILDEDIYTSRGPESWSLDKSIGEEYANGSNKIKAVLVAGAGLKNGTHISHISAKPNEKETISKGVFEVVSHEVINNVYYIEVKQL